MRRLMIASLAALGVAATALQAQAMGNGWELTHGRDGARAETRDNLSRTPATVDATRLQLAEREGEEVRRPYTSGVPKGAVFGNRFSQWGNEGGR